MSKNDFFEEKKYLQETLQLAKKAISWTNPNPMVGCVIVKNGKVIEQYLDDKPFPSYLISGFISEKPMHVVAAIDNKTKKAIIITVYEPDPKLWQKGFEKRK